MNYITFNEIIEVNGLLEEKGLNFKVHLRDACGKQSCWIEPLGNCACEGRYEEMYQVVEESSIQNTAFSIWDKMELHEIFRKIREGGRPVPLFVPLLQKTEATSKVVFFMHEIAYWGTDQEVKYLISYFDSLNFL